MTIEELQAEIARLTQERDEALRKAQFTEEYYEGILPKLQATQVHLATREVEIARVVQVLKVADAAINPSDLDGISMHEWNDRLKAATAQIRAAVANIAPAPQEPQR